MSDLPAIDTMESAFARAKAAQSRGQSQIHIAVNAEGRRFARSIVRPWHPTRLIAPGHVVKRYADEDGTIQVLVALVDAVDILTGVRDAQIRALESPAPVRKRRRQSIRLAR